MSHWQRFWLTVAGCGAFGIAAFGQNVISAKAGLIHLAEGKVLVNDKEVKVNSKPGDFTEMKNGEVLRTEEGRAEVLLTPGVVLRVAENSSFKLVESKLEDIRVELLGGSVIVEAAEVNKHDSIVMTVGDAKIDFRERGLFRVDANPASLRVYDGQAVVTASGQTLTVKEGRQTSLGGVLQASKFDKETGDAFHRWVGRRSSYLAMANLAAAKSMYDNNMSCGVGCWFFNPYFGYFTFIPGFRNYTSYWGYSYYTPRRIESVYYRPAPAMSNSAAAWADNSIRHFPNASGRMSSGSTYSGGVYSSAPAPPPSSAPAAPAAGPRSGDSGGSRGAGGGGR